MLSLVAKLFLHANLTRRYAWLCALKGGVIAISLLVLSGCKSFDAIFDTDQRLVSQRAMKQTMQTRAAWPASVPLPSNSPSPHQRGLFIETPNGPVAAAFTSRSLGMKPNRCASLNNYWCIKTPTDGQRWEGQIGQDHSGHAYFSDPVYSARAFARIIRSYYLRRGVKSVSGIINRYAPPSDCIGSLHYCPINGATISQHGPINQVGRFGGKHIFYTSKKPDRNFFKPSQNCQKVLLYCAQGRNKTEDYSTDIARMLQVSPTSNLNLFDSMGRIHYSRMVALMKAIAKWELGSQYSIDEALIREGMIMEVSDFRDSSPKTWPGILPQAFN